MVRRRLVVTTGMGLLAACGLMVAEASDLRPLLQSQAVQLVEQLRTLPTPLPAAPRSDGRIDPVEERRREVYRQLRELRGDTVAALATALGDADVSMKRNVALALNVLASTWFEPSQPRLDIRACLPALRRALTGSSADVRRSAQRAIDRIEGQQKGPAV